MARRNSVEDTGDHYQRANRGEWPESEDTRGAAYVRRRKNPQGEAKEDSSGIRKEYPKHARRCFFEIGAKFPAMIRESRSQQQRQQGHGADDLSAGESTQECLSIVGTLLNQGAPAHGRSDATQKSIEQRQKIENQEGHRSSPSRPARRPSCFLSSAGRVRRTPTKVWNTLGAGVFQILAP